MAHERMPLHYHEAGHAVVAMACGFMITRVTVVTSEHAAGHVHFNYPEIDLTAPPVEVCRKLALVFMAGLAGDCVNFEMNGQGDPNETANGSASDQKQAYEALSLIKEYNLDPYLGFAKWVLNKSEYRLILDEIAQKLEAYELIVGDYLTEVYDRTPKLSDKDMLFLEVAVRNFIES